MAFLYSSAPAWTFSHLAKMLFGDSILMFLEGLLLLMCSPFGLAVIAGALIHFVVRLRLCHRMVTGFRGWWNQPWFLIRVNVVDTQGRPIMENNNYQQQQPGPDSDNRAPPAVRGDQLNAVN